MAAIGVDCQAMPRWDTTPEAASAASFHPSNAAIATGWSSGPSTSLNLMTSPPGCLGFAWTCALQPTSPRTLVAVPVAHTVFTGPLLCPTINVYTEEAYERACDRRGYRTSWRFALSPHRTRGGRGRSDGHDASGQRGDY